jgi:hypothetical protein
MAWHKLNLDATWHGLGLTYVSCGMSYPSLVYVLHGMSWPSLGATWHVLVLVKCHVACHKFHVVCFMLCSCAMWDGLDLTYVPHGMV